MNSKIDNWFSKWSVNFTTYKMLALGIVLIVLSIFMLLQTPGYVRADGLNAVDSAAFAPRLVYSVLLIFGVVITVQQVLLLKALKIEKEEMTVSKDDNAGNQKALLILGTILVYIVLMYILGFILASILYLMSNMIIMSEKGSRNIKMYLLISVIISVVVYYCFKEFIFVNLPTGMLF